MAVNNTTSRSFYVGTYTQLAPHLITASGLGIYHYRLDLSTGKLSAHGLVAHVSNPSYLHVSADNLYLYAVSEIDANTTGKSQAGGIHAFKIDHQGSLAPINQQLAEGDSPCYLSTDSANRAVFSANYGSGNILMSSLTATGALNTTTFSQQHYGSGPNKARQEAPHCHCAIPDNDGQYMFGVDLGTDQIISYRVHYESCQLIVNQVLQLPSGTGPRHLVFHPSADFAFVSYELSNQISLLSYDKKHGTLTHLQQIDTLNTPLSVENYGADLHISHCGQFVYASNRGHDSISVYHFDPSLRKLTFVANHSCGGAYPRGFAIDPGDNFLIVANQNSGNLVSFKRDTNSGKLIQVDSLDEVPTPVCIKFINA